MDGGKRAGPETNLSPGLGQTLESGIRVLVPRHGMHVGQRIMLVKEPGLDLFMQLVVPVGLNGKLVEAFIDTGCGRTLVRQAEGAPLAEVLQIRCIHDV